MATDGTILVAGDTLIDFLPDQPGPPHEAGGYTPNFGGSAANVALGLDRLGVSPLFWTRLADDDFGGFLREHLYASSIPKTYLIRDQKARTTLAVVSHDANGDRSFTFYRDGGADTRMLAGTIPDSTLADTAWVHTTGVTLSVEPSRSATLDLQERATEPTTVSLDPNWRPEMWHSRQEYAAVIRGALGNVDVVKATEDDLAPAGFDTEDRRELIEAVAALGPHTVILTLGSEGAVCFGSEQSPIPGFVQHSGYEVETVDSTGAGDVFLAGFIASMTSGVRDPERLLGLANAAGAVATTKPGAVSALTGLEEIRNFHNEIPWE
jgi:fructokinase